jgi:hypothetical protein
MAHSKMQIALQPRHFILTETVIFGQEPTVAKRHESSISIFADLPSTSLIYTILFPTAQNVIQSNVLGQTAASRCESSPTFQGLTPSLSSGCVAEGLEEPKQTVLVLPSLQ